MQMQKYTILQKDMESLAIVPNTPTGLVTPDVLRKIADVAEKYKALVKLTNAQRFALVGFSQETLSEAVGELGIPLATAAGAFVRSVKACPGTATCRLGKQDSLSLAMELDKRYHGRALPSKFKIAVSGCPNSCAESAVVDLGIIGVKDGFRVLVGGSAGAKPRIADELAKVATQEEVLALAEKIINYYAVNAKRGERLARMIERIGLEKFRSEVLQNGHDG
jgi:NAD(P)H-nitrite reductase large subunit